jgi:hydroxyacyl-ACP dehydratase HTD2-like protein with hotdog domain
VPETVAPCGVRTRGEPPGHPAVLLFRYSAVTFNAHRIHYDRPYAMKVEGYPGLVVHGPLVVMLLSDLLQRHRPGAQVRQFSFQKGGLATSATAQIA